MRTASSINRIARKRAPMRHRRAMVAAGVALAVTATLHPREAAAVNNNWTGLSNLSWTNTGNWSLGAVPTSTHDVFFPSVIPATGSALSLTGNQAAHSLTFNNTYSLSGGNLALGDGLTTTTLSVASGRTATISSAVTASFLTKSGSGAAVLSGNNTIGGNLTVSAGSLSCSGQINVTDFTNSGTFINNGTFHAANGLNTSTGVIENNSGTMLFDYLENRGTVRAVNGTITITDGDNFGNIDTAATGTVVLGSMFHEDGSSITGSGTVIATGTQELHGNLSGTFSLVLNGGSIIMGQGIGINVGSIVVPVGSSFGVTGFVSAGSVQAAGNGLSITAGGGFLSANQTTLDTTAGPCTVSVESDNSSPGTLSIGSDVTVTGNGAAAIASTGSGTSRGVAQLGGAQKTFTVSDAAATLTISALLTNGSVRKTGSGTMVLPAANTYASGTTLAGGAVEISNTGALGTGGVTFSGGQLNLRSDAATTTYTNSLTVAPASTVAVNIGRITAGSPNTFVLNAMTMGRNLNVSGTGTLRFGGATLANTLDINNSATLEINGAVSGGFAVTLNSGGGTTIFSGAAANTYTGLTSANSGVLQLAKTAGVNAMAGNLAAFTGGTVRWMASNQVPNASSITVNGSGSAIDLNGRSETVASLSMTGGTLKTGAGTLSVTSLTIQPSTVASIIDTTGGGTVTPATAIDMTGISEKLIFRGGDVGSWNGSAYTGITGKIQTGRGDGSWNGSTGIVTHMTDATTSVLTTLAVVSAAESNYLGGTFAGRSVVAGDVLVMYTWGGDADLNGELDGDDYFYIDSNIINVLAHGFHNGDYDYNGEIDGDDYFVIDSNIIWAQNHPGSFPTGAGGGGLAAVPEPAGLAVIMLLGGAGIARRRRRSRR